MALGGAKVADKIGVVAALIERADVLVVSCANRPLPANRQLTVAQPPADRSQMASLPPFTCCRSGWTCPLQHARPPIPRARQIGGRMAFTFLAAQGVSVGGTQVEEDWLEVGWAGVPRAHTALRPSA